MPIFYVEVVEYDTEQVVKRLGPFPSEPQADKCCSGVDRNLNHERFYTQTHETDDDLEVA